MWIDGALRFIKRGGRQVAFHDKYGTYRLGSGQGPITVEWRNVKYYRGGRSPGGTPTPPRARGRRRRTRRLAARTPFRHRTPAAAWMQRVVRVEPAARAAAEDPGAPGDPADRGAPGEPAAPADPAPEARAAAAARVAGGTGGTGGSAGQSGRGGSAGRGGASASGGTVGTGSPADRARVDARWPRAPRIGGQRHWPVRSWRCC
jgi:hypothetical protein